MKTKTETKTKIEDARRKAEKVVEEAGRRASFEFLKMCVGLGIAAGSLWCVYRGCKSVVTLTDAANAAMTRRVGSKSEGISFDPGWRTAKPMDLLDREALDAVIEEKASAYDVDADDLRGMIHVESRWDPNAKNNGALGLMQLRPKTRAHLGMSDEEAMQPVANIEGGAAWYARKKEEQRGSRDEAIQSYYCGPCRLGDDCGVDAHGRQIPPCIGAPRGLAYLAKVNRARGLKPTQPLMLDAKREAQKPKRQG